MAGMARPGCATATGAARPTGPAPRRTDGRRSCPSRHPTHAQRKRAAPFRERPLFVGMHPLRIQARLMISPLISRNTSLIMMTPSTLPASVTTA